MGLSIDSPNDKEKAKQTKNVVSMVMHVISQLPSAWWRFLKITYNPWYALTALFSTNTHKLFLLSGVFTKPEGEGSNYL